MHGSRSRNDGVFVDQTRMQSKENSDGPFFWTNDQILTIGSTSLIEDACGGKLPSEALQRKHVYRAAVRNQVHAGWGIRGEPLAVCR